MESFLATTTAHGLNRINVENRLGRFLWRLICVLLYGGCIMMVANVFRQYFNEKTNKTTHTEVQFLDRNGSEFPKFVFCIPEKNTHLKDEYERRMMFRMSNKVNSEAAPREEWVDEFPKFSPTILDYGFAEGEGWDTQWAFCYKLQSAWKFFKIVVDQKLRANLIHKSNSSSSAPDLHNHNTYSSDYSNSTHLVHEYDNSSHSETNSSLPANFWEDAESFLLVFLSFSNKPHEKFLEMRRSSHLTIKEAKEECVQFSLHRLQHFKTVNLGEDHELCEEPKPEQTDYNQAYCLDVCFFNEAAIRNLTNRKCNLIRKEFTEDILEETKWRSALDEIPIRRKVHHYLKYYSWLHARNQSCTAEDLHLDDDDAYTLLQKCCFQKCCPAISSFSYQFKRNVFKEEEYSHNYCEKGLFLLKGRRLKMTTFEDVPKMSLVDLFGLVGGYLGLFVGISLVTLFEFFEFGITWCFGGRNKKMKQTDDSS